MKYRSVFFIGFIVIVSLVYTWYEANRPEPLNWEETYSPMDKIPYGTYIVYHSLEQLFPAAEITTSRLPLLGQLTENDSAQGAAYVFIGERFGPDPVEVRHLLDWVESGNRIFIAAAQMSDTLLAAMGLEITTDWEKAESHLNFSGFQAKAYSFDNACMTCYTFRETFAGECLGFRKDTSQVDFVRVALGDGTIFLNLNPKAFTNYQALDSAGGDYYYRALSWLPEGTKTIIWDAYHTLGPLGDQTPLRVILRYPALQMALYLLLAGGLLYVLFKVKREQRPIPVIVPPENRMLGFMATISSLYLKQKDHYSIAVKEITFFMEEVRTHYLIRTDVLDEQFVGLLSGRSGVEVEKTARLISLICRIQESKRADEEMLRALMKGTEEQLKQTFRTKSKMKSLLGTL